VPVGLHHAEEVHEGVVFGVGEAMPNLDGDSVFLRRALPPIEPVQIGPLGGPGRNAETSVS
jgi:hypothetical protein